MNKANRAQNKQDNKKKIDRKSSIKRQKQKEMEKREGGSRSEKIAESGDDVRLLHEAYQFLMRKYCPDKSKGKKKSDEPEEEDTGAVGMMMF